MVARLTLRRALAALGALALAAAPVHGEGRPRYGGVVTGALLGEPAGFDPVAAERHWTALFGLLGRVPRG